MRTLHRRDSGSEPIRITTAGTSPAEDLRGRQRRYLISMSIRTLCFIGGVAVGPGWLRWVLIAGAVFLPYFAVVMANTKGPRSEDLDLPSSTSTTKSLPPSRHDSLGPFD